jgi:hypothetical protein
LSYLGENARIEFDYSNFELTESLDTYLSMRYDTLQALAKNNNISQSVLMKIDRLTEFQAAKESIEAIESQLSQVTKGLEDGESVYIDKDSAIESVARDTSQFFTTIDSINTLIAGELGRPLSFVNGVGGSAMSDTGESDREASARARERFYLEHIRPLLISIDINHKSLTLNIEVKNMSNVSTATAIVDGSDCLTLADKQKILRGVGLSGDGVR